MLVSIQLGLGIAELSLGRIERSLLRCADTTKPLPGVGDTYRNGAIRQVVRQAGETATDYIVSIRWR